jgi:hypothetical protein
VAASIQPRKLTSSIPESPCRDHDRVDRPPPLLGPVDVLEVEPEGELVEGQAGADPEEDGDDLPPRVARMDRDADVPAGQQQQDPPDEMVDVRPPHLDVAGPPAHLRLDHVGARPDEPEREQERDEEQELRLAPRVDDPVAVEIAHAGQHRRHRRKPI